jgi:hypothetical protein
LEGGVVGRWERQQRRRKQRRLYLLPDAAERLALTVRNDASLTGRCACGAEGELVHLAPRIAELRFEHEHDCPAVAVGGGG